MGIPNLSQDQSAGTAKLNRMLHARAPTGTEAGELLGDVEMIHVLVDEKELIAADAFMPGASESWRRSFGPGSDGRRVLQWVPAAGGCRLIVRSNPGGELLYEGKAKVRAAKLRIVPKAAVLTVPIRLEDLAPESLLIAASLNRLVDYEIVADRLEGVGGGAGVEGGLPFGTDDDLIEVDPGDLVSVSRVMGDGSRKDAAGVVVSVGGGRIVYRTALVDAPDSMPSECAHSEVQTSLKVCGPKGGPPGPTMAKLAERSPNCTPDDLILAVLQAQSSGLASLEEGWPLTADVIDTAAALAAPSEERDQFLGGPPVVEPDETMDDDGDVLPPEADEDPGESW